MTKKNNSFHIYLNESANYKSYKDLESFVQDGNDLSSIPPWPLYFTLKQESSDQLIESVKHMNPYQQQVLRDLESWDKDSFDVSKFDEWCLTFFKTNDLNVIADFVQTYDFYLYLKGRFNIYTFDLENPQYPDHDNFFLTEDNCYLFEYAKNYKYPEELKFLVRNLYAQLGVEHARDILLNVVSDTFSQMEETAYQSKKERLRDIGYVDYYEALEFKKTLNNEQLEKFIQKKINTSIAFPDSTPENTNPHYSKVVSSFSHGFESIYEELNKIEGQDKINLLLFNFSRLVNSQLVLEGAFSDGEINFIEIGDKCKQRIKLAIDELKRKCSEKIGDKSLLEHFSFTDLYQVGNSLLNNKFQYLEKALSESGFSDSTKYFLGDHWNIFIEDMKDNNFKFKKNGMTSYIDNSSSYKDFVEKVNLLVNSIPIILQFKKTLSSLDGKNKDISVNFKWDDIDFESLVITQLVRFYLKKESSEGFVVSFDEFLLFIEQGYKNSEQLRKDFLKMYSLDTINNFSKYLDTILDENFSFLQDSTISDIKPKFVSGVIISS